MRPAVRILLVAAAVAAALTCGNDVVAPVAGELKVNLATPNSGDGAILISVAGPVALTSVTAPAGLRVFAGPLTGTTTKFAITGPLTSGVVLMLGVQDVNKVASYTAGMLQVAATSYALRSISGYSLTVSK